jgi:hypothetical protein
MPSSGTRNIVFVFIGIIVLGIGLGLSFFGLAVAGIAIMAFGLVRTDFPTTLSRTVALIRETGALLKYTFYIAIFAGDFFVILVSVGFGSRFYGILGMVLLPTITQIPILYLLIKDMRRKDKMLPRSEAYETSPQEFKQALDEYVEILEKKAEDDEKTS